MSYLNSFFSKYLLTYRNVARIRVPYRTQADKCGETGAVKTRKVEDAIKVDPEKKDTTSTEKCAIHAFYEVEDGFEIYPIEGSGPEYREKLSSVLETHSCELKQGKAIIFPTVAVTSSGYDYVVLTSLGPKNACYNTLENIDELRENTRNGLSAALKWIKHRQCLTENLFVAADKDILPADVSKEIIQLWTGSYDLEQAQGQVDLGTAGRYRGVAQNYARHLLSTPTNEMTPADFAQAAMDELCRFGVKVTAHDEEWIKGAKMDSFMAVAKGSCESPIFLELEYRAGKKEEAPILIVAKGVTFDSGGLCVKKPEDMQKRDSLAGAAVTMSALRSLAAMGVPININCVIPLCENMLSGQCIKVGDVYRALNGTSIQVEDTDMEGQVMLADALVYGQAKYRPSLVIDVSTLVDGMAYGLGSGAFACFSNSDLYYNIIQEAGAITGDRPWRLPLWQYFQRQLSNLSGVDLRNRGSGKGAPCLGAAFISNFVCGNWIHMDVTGLNNYPPSEKPLYLDEDTVDGRPARTLFHLLKLLSEREKEDKPQ